jgi:hypothetical protein
LSAGKSAPTVPSDQGFYQSLWDDPDRSNRTLKRTGPQSQVALAPQTKKAKTSSVSTAEEFPQSASERPLPQELPPKSFEEATQIAVEAWKVAFPSLRFPAELIGLFPAAQSPLVAAPHQSDPQPPPLTHQPTTNSSRSKVAINRNLES